MLKEPLSKFNPFQQVWVNGYLTREQLVPWEKKKKKRPGYDEVQFKLNNNIKCGYQVRHYRPLLGGEIWNWMNNLLCYFIFCEMISVSGRFKQR